MPLVVTHLLGKFPILYERPILEEIAALEKEGIHPHIAAFHGGSWVLPFELRQLAEVVTHLDVVRALGQPISVPAGIVAGLVGGVLSPRCMLAGLAAAPGGRRISSFWRRIRLAEVVQATRSALIHAQFGHLGLLAMPVARRLRVPLFVSFRGQDVLLVGRTAERARKKLFDVASRVLVRSRDMAHDVAQLGCPPAKLFLQPTGIDVASIQLLERKHPGKERKIVILMAGRLVRKKGMDDGLRALAEARLSASGPCVIIVGDGPERVPLGLLSQDLHIAQRVEFLGEIPHEELVDAVMPASHIFMLPCRTAPDGEKEGIPNCLKEACASGLPVISTRHAGIPDCIVDGENGFLTDEGDVKGLAAALVKLLEQPERWPVMGRRGRGRMEDQYDIQQLAPKMASYYYATVGSLRD